MLRFCFSLFAFRFSVFAFISSFKTSYADRGRGKGGLLLFTCSSTEPSVLVTLPMVTRRVSPSRWMFPASLPARGLPPVNPQIEPNPVGLLYATDAQGCGLHGSPQRQRQTHPSAPMIRRGGRNCFHSQCCCGNDGRTQGPREQRRNTRRHMIRERFAMGSGQLGGVGAVARKAHSLERLARVDWVDVSGESIWCAPELPPRPTCAISGQLRHQRHLRA